MCEESHVFRIITEHAAEHQLVSGKQIWGSHPMRLKYDKLTCGKSQFPNQFFIFGELVLGSEKTKCVRTCCKTRGQRSFPTHFEDFTNGHRSAELSPKVYFPFLIPSTVLY